MHQRAYLPTRLMLGFSGFGFLWWGCLKLGVFQTEEGVMALR